jgi:hypothetical protein
VEQGLTIILQVIYFLCTRPKSQAGALGSCFAVTLAIHEVIPLTSVSSVTDIDEESYSDINPSGSLNHRWGMEDADQDS